MLESRAHHHVGEDKEAEEKVADDAVGGSKLHLGEQVVEDDGEADTPDGGADDGDAMPTTEARISEGSVLMRCGHLHARERQLWEYWDNTIIAGMKGQLSRVSTHPIPMPNP